MTPLLKFTTPFYLGSANDMSTLPSLYQFVRMQVPDELIEARVMPMRQQKDEGTTSSFCFEEIILDRFVRIIRQRSVFAIFFS